MERLADYVIIAPGPGDAAELGAVHVQAWRETYSGLIPDAYLDAMEPRVHARRWRRLLTAAREGEFVLAAEGQGGLVGYCEGLAPGDDGVAEVATLYLLRSVQSAGLGGRLLGAAARVLAAREAVALRIWVLEANRAARGFYEHVGGVETERRPVRGWGGALCETAYVWPEIAALARR